MSESHRSTLLDGYVHAHGLKGGNDNNEDLGTGIEIDDEYDLYMGMGKEEGKWKRIDVIEA